MALACGMIAWHDDMSRVWGLDIMACVDAMVCAVLCCAVLCCAVLCCAVLCCAVLCCAVRPAGQHHPSIVGERVGAVRGAGEGGVWAGVTGVRQNEAEDSGGSR